MEAPLIQLAMTVAAVTAAVLTPPASAPASAPAASTSVIREVVVSAGDKVRVRKAPASRPWQRIGSGVRGWRSATLPLRSGVGAGGDLLIRRDFRVSPGTQRVSIRLAHRARARLWLDGVPAGTVAAGRNRITLHPAAGRHRLAIRLRNPDPRSLLRLRVRAHQAAVAGPQPVPNPTATVPTPSPSSPVLPPAVVDPPVNDITRVCRIDDPRLPEISGLAAGVSDPSVLWVHNDSGDSARIFALDRTSCAVRAEVRLVGVSAGDIEGIAMGRAEDGSAELWVGDIGDNLAQRPSIRLYRLPEPTVADQTVSVRIVTVTWTDGPRDCESIAVDPVPGGAVYLVSKEASGSGVFRLDGDYRVSGQATTGSELSVAGNSATDAAIAPDRSRSIIRYYSSAEMRSGVLPGTNPARASMPEQRQGEAITFAPDSRSVYLASEGKDDLIRMPLNAWAP